MIKQIEVKGLKVNFWDDFEDGTRGVSIWNKEATKTLMFVEFLDFVPLTETDEDYLNNCLRLIPREIFWDVIDDILSHIDECNYCILNRETKYVTIVTD